MLREIFRATRGDITITLPKQYVNKVIEILVFPVSEAEFEKKPHKGKPEKTPNFNQIKIATKNWHFNRAEIYDE